MKLKPNGQAIFSADHASIFCMLIALAIFVGNAGATQETAATPANVRIYNVKPNELIGISRLKQEPSISDVQIIDLSIIPQMEAMFSAHANDKINPKSIAEIKALSAQLPRLQLQRLANAQMAFFDLQTRYDVTIDDLPVVIFEQDKKLYLYKGNDAYQGFLLWQQAKR